MYPVTIIDNFFENPDNIRDFALSQDFSRKDNCGWPGIRSPMLLDIDSNFYKDVMSKILSVYFNIPGDSIAVNFQAFFQSINESFEEGWCHVDNGVTMAGVVYLTPEAPVEAGTSIYSDPSKEIDFSVCENKLLFYDGKIQNLDTYRKIRNEFNSNFTKIVDVGNLYNRLVMYPGDCFHRENKFFGSTIDDSRLTLVFFVNLQTGSCLTPIERTKNIPL